MDIYDRIAGLLKEKRLTKKEMSQTLNISYSTLASLFQRRSMNVDIELMKKIANYLDTTLEYLVTGNETYKYPTTSDYFSNFTIITVKNKDTKAYYRLNEEDFETVTTILDKFKSN